MTEPTDNERMMKRVEDLLKKAEDFRRHGEDGSADAAIDRANVIMTKYSIDQLTIAARLATGSQPADEITTHVIDIKGIYRKALATTLAALVSAYTDTVKPFTSTFGNVERLHMVGYKSEVEQLSMLVASIMLQAVGGTTNWWKTSPERNYLTGMAAYKARRQFVYSFVVGATDRIARARRGAVKQATDSDPGTALALRTRESEVDAYLRARYRLTTSSPYMKPGSASAASAGYAAGQRANTGDRPIGSDGRQIGT
jgi:hypothetical protein